MSEFTIKTPNGSRVIGAGHPAFLVAEMSGNHNQNIKRAFEIVDAAADAGVDAVKLQTYTPDTLTIDCDNEYFKINSGSAWDGKTLYQLYKEAYTPWEWHEEIKKRAEGKGLVFFSTPFDETAVDFLENLEVPMYKVASFEIVDLELLKKIGQTKKPVIISRGMASEEEIREAVSTLKQAGATEVAVLHCVSSYPAKPENMNLATIPDIREKFGVVSGLSDHTLGTEVSAAAVALGANIIEKHLTLRRSEGGPDSEFSLEPEEFKQLAEDVRQTEKAVGQPSYGAGKSEAGNKVFRRSLFAVKNIKQGEELNNENVRSIRPGFGLPPRHYQEVLGKKAKQDIPPGTPLSWDILE